MSDLAFNLSGEPFEVPHAAVGWRVRKLKPKGAPEVVYDREGIPLVLPIDADMEDMRREARNEGRYRLDPVDDHCRIIPNTPSAYVCIHASELLAQPSPTARPASSNMENALIEAMRVNSELARTIVDRFPVMLESAAVLLRAADGAGMPAREPRVVPDPVKDEDEDEAEGEDEDEDEVKTEAPPPKPSGWASLLETLIPLVAPAIMNAVVNGKVQLPGGLAALFDCRRASPKANPATERAANTPAPARTSPTSVRTSSLRTVAPTMGGTAPSRVSGPSPAATTGNEAASTRASSLRVVAPMVSSSDPSVAAPAGDEAASAHTSGLRIVAPMVAEAASLRGSDLPGASAGSNAAPPHASHASHAHVAAQPANEAPVVEHESTTEGTPELEVPPVSATDTELPMLDPAAIAHFVAIQGALTFREGMLARALAAELSPSEMRTWLAELRRLSVPDAVAKIREVLGADDSSNTGGVS